MKWQFLVLILLAVDCRGTQICPTWFRLSSSTSECECGSKLDGAVKCNNMTEEVSIALEYCMTLSNISGRLQLVAGNTNNVFIGRSPRGYTLVPENVSKLNEFMCKNSNRKGFLCGDCVSGYGYAPNSHSKECAKCDTMYAVAIFLIFGILPMTICFVLIIVFHLNFPSGYLFPYIMFCQCHVASVKAYTGLYYTMGSSMGSFGKFNLNLSILLSGLSQYFVGVYYSLSPVCLHHSLSEIHVLFLDYIFCLYPLLLIVLACVCIELHARNCRIVVFASKLFNRMFSCIERKWRVSDSIIHAYATFYFLSFFYLIYLSYSILYALSVYDVNGKVIKTVLMYESKIEWFGLSHLPYALPAILLLMLLGVCPTLILCLHPTRLFRKCFKIRPRTQLMLNTFVETFSSCYKDGLNKTYDFRFLTSLPMIAGLCMFVLFPSYNYELRLYFHCIFSLSFLSLGFMFAFLKPYKSTYMNVSISFHTTIIAINVLILTLWFEGQVMSDKVLASAFTFFCLSPHIFAITTILYKLIVFFPCIKIRMEIALKGFLSLFRRTSNHEVDSPFTDLPHRLEDSNAYQILN